MLLNAKSGVFAMERAEICRYIDEGANFYLRLLGDAEHMEYCSNGYYSVIRPKPGEEGGTSLFDIRLGLLPDDEIERKITEIKQMNLHTWWGFNLSEKVQNILWKGQQRPQPLPEPNDEEACMALLPEEKPVYGKWNSSITVKKVDNAEDFRVWATISNQVLHSGYSIMHPINHYHLSKAGIMPCYIAYDNKTPAAVAAIMNNHEISSLEFVATLQEYRRKGLANAVCYKAIEDAFQNGSKIITLRALPAGKRLFLTLGFRIY
jgi:ribosomal protein S18 acetylase RimI-like enzyme